MKDDRPFELRVIPLGPTDYGIALFQKRTNGVRPARLKSSNGNAVQNPREMQQVAWVHGTPFRAIVEPVMATLKRSGYRPADLCRSRKAPFLLPEDEGVRLGLLMLAVKPLRKPTRMDTVAAQISGMGDEEAYYWFSKGTSHDIARRAQKALRMLLAKE